MMQLFTVRRITGREGIALGAVESSCRLRDPSEVL